jgi:hypothetical protein
MTKLEALKKSAKVVSKLSEDSLASLKSLLNIEEAKVLDFNGIEHYEQFQSLVKEGYASKEFRHYKITEDGKTLLEAVDMAKTNAQKFNDLLKEEKDSSKQIVLEYKKHDEAKNLITTDVAKFDIETDGIPVIKVNEEAYANLIHRSRGEHWKQYLGEDGRQLIRQKKLARFYVEDETTGRRYLYIVPK